MRRKVLIPTTLLALILALMSLSSIFQWEVGGEYVAEDFEIAERYAVNANGTHIDPEGKQPVVVGTDFGVDNTRWAVVGFSLIYDNKTTIMGTNQAGFVKNATENTRAYSETPLIVVEAGNKRRYESSIYTKLAGTAGYQWHNINFVINPANFAYTSLVYGRSLYDNLMLEIASGSRAALAEKMAGGGVGWLNAIISAKSSATSDHTAIKANMLYKDGAGAYTYPVRTFVTYNGWKASASWPDTSYDTVRMYFEIRFNTPKIVELDKTNPTISTTYTPSSWTNGNVTITATASDSGGSGLNRIVKADGGAVYAASASQTVTANGSYTFTAYDDAGNSASTTRSITNIDKTAPGVTFSPNGGGWTSGNLTTTVTPNDSGSGVNIWYYTLRRSDNTPIEQGSIAGAGAKTFTISSTGQYWVETSITDNAGNNSKPSSNSFYVDKDKPTFVSTTVTGERYTNGVWKWFRPDDLINVNLSMDDVGSGLRNVYAQVTDNGNFQRRIGLNADGGTPWVDFQGGNSAYNFSSYTGKWVSSSGNRRNLNYTFKIPYDGNYSYFAQALDWVGHWAGANEATGLGVGVGLAIDGTNPTAPTINLSRTGWGSSNVTFSVTGGADSGSGLASRQYKIGNGAWTGFSTDVTISAEGATTVYARTVDNVGNISSEVSKTVYKDSANPTIVFSPNGGDWKNSHSVTVTPGDNGSGVKDWSYSLKRADGSVVESASITGGAPKSFTMTDSGEYYVEATVSDNVGNVTSSTSNRFYVDSTSPTHTSHSITGHKYKNGNDYWVGYGDTISYVHRANDAHSGLKFMYLRLIDSVNGYDVRSQHVLTNTTTHNNQFMTGSSITIGSALRSSVSGGSATVTWGATAQNGYEGDYAVQYYYTDVADNIVGYISTGMRLRVDGTKPTTPVVTLSNSGWTNSNVTVSIAGGSDSRSGVSKTEYRLNGGTWVTYSVPFVVSSAGQTIVEARTLDNVGNVSESATETVRIDRDAPTVSASDTDYTWGKVSKSVTLNYADAGGSGVAVKQYVVTDSTAVPTSGWVNYSSAVNIATDGVHYIHYKVVDGAGNSVTGYFGPYRIDRTAPIVTASDTDYSWSNGTKSVALSYVDSGGSGLSATQYRVTTTTTTPTTGWVNYSGSIPLSAEGVFYIHYKALDNAGNERVGYFGPYRSDMTVPTVSSSNVDYTWGNVNKSVTLTYSDIGGSGIDSQQYLVTTNTTTPTSGWLDYTGSLTISSNGVYYIHYKVVDGAGNETKGYFGPYRLDKNLPTVSASDTNYNWGNADKSITLTVADTGGSGVASRQYLVTGTTVTPTTGWVNYSTPVAISNEGVHYLHYKVVDGAGNTVTGYFGPYRLDKTAPSASANNTDYSWGKVDKSVGLTFNDAGGSTISTSQYVITNNSTTPTTGWINYTTALSITTEGQHYVHYKVVDVAGNVTNGYFGPYRIDKTAPSIGFNPTSTSWGKRADVTVSTSDTGGSAINATTRKYQWSTSTTVPTTWVDLPADGKVSQTADGRWYLHVKVSDVAGNETVTRSGLYNVDTVIPSGDFGISYEPHGAVLTISPSGVSDTLVNGAISGVKELRVKVTAETASGNVEFTQVVTNLNTPFVFNGRSIHETFNGRANKITVHMEVVDNAGNINNGLQDKEAIVYYVNSNVVKSADGMIVGAGNKVQGGDMLMVYVEAFGNPDSIEVKGYKVGEPSKLLKNFNYVVNNTGNVNVVTDPTRKTTVYSEVLNLGLPKFVDIYQEPGTYNLEIIVKKGGASPIVRSQTHVINVDTDPVITELRTRLFFKLPSR